jgi:hypothetical protein
VEGHDMNLQQMIEATRCPDCISQTPELHPIDGVWHVLIQHDLTCPRLPEIEARQSQGPAT